MRAEKIVEKEEKKIVRNEYAGFSESQLDSVYATIQYFMTHKQTKEYEKLNVQGKRTFIDLVWKSLDPIPATEENEYREIHTTASQVCDEMSSRQSGSLNGVVPASGPSTIAGLSMSNMGSPMNDWFGPTNMVPIHSRSGNIMRQVMPIFFLKESVPRGHELVFTNNRDENYIPNWERYFPLLTLQDIYRELGSALNR